MFPDDSAVVSWINWGDETAQRDQDQGVGRNQGSIADTVGGGGVHPGNKLEWAKLQPGFSEEVLQRLQGDATYVI